MHKIMSSEADVLLKKICTYFKETGNTRFTSFDIGPGIIQANLYELELFDYVTIADDVNGTIHLTEKALNYFKTN